MYAITTWCLYGATNSGNSTPMKPSPFLPITHTPQLLCFAILDTLLTSLSEAPVYSAICWFVIRAMVFVLSLFASRLEADSHITINVVICKSDTPICESLRIAVCAHILPTLFRETPGIDGKNREHARLRRVDKTIEKQRNQPFPTGSRIVRAEVYGTLLFVVGE